MAILVKVIVFNLFRKKFYKAFYRKRPAAANFMNVILEAWNVGLSLGYALVRAVKLIAITAIFLGRIDAPFLDKGVGFIGGMPLDAYPYAFRTDLLLRTFTADEISLTIINMHVSFAHLPIFARRGPSTSIFGKAGLHLYVEAVPWTKFCISRGKLLASVVCYRFDAVATQISYQEQIRSRR